jgi:hypothetical protein
LAVARPLFSAYEEANRASVRWNQRIARRRVHGAHGEVVAVRAERDGAALLAPPAEPYLVIERGIPCRRPRQALSFAGRRYAAPAARHGERVEPVRGPDKVEAYSTVDGAYSAATAADGQSACCPDPADRSVELAECCARTPSSTSTPAALAL